MNMKKKNLCKSYLSYLYDIFSNLQLINVHDKENLSIKYYLFFYFFLFYILLSHDDVLLGRNHDWSVYRFSGHGKQRDIQLQRAAGLFFIIVKCLRAATSVPVSIVQPLKKETKVSLVIDVHDFHAPAHRICTITVSTGR